MSLKPSPDLNWMAVSWGGPDEPVAQACSMCDAPLKEDEPPLMVWNSEGWAASFCPDCQRKWWQGGH